MNADVQENGAKGMLRGARLKSSSRNMQESIMEVLADFEAFQKCEGGRKAVML